jgi:hypothetical protein
VTFSKAIDPATFDDQALSLTLDGGPNLITSAVTVTALSSNTFTLGGLGPLTGAPGQYVLSVNAAAVKDPDGTPGLGAKSNVWTMITTGPVITALQQLATNPRNIVVPSLDVTFSEPIDPATLDYHDVTLTRDGGPNLVDSTVTVTPSSGTTYRIGNLNWAQGYAGTYSFTVDAAGVVDLAGNPGLGTTNETWQMILTVPSAPTNLVMTPDLGISATDGLTSTNSVTFSGSLGTSNLTVRVYDTTSGADLGTATVTGTNFSTELTFTVEGRHHLQFNAVDAAGNVSIPTYFDLFLDVIPPTSRSRSPNRSTPTPSAPPMSC